MYIGKCTSEDKRKADWVYTGSEPGVKMEIPARSHWL